MTDPPRQLDVIQRWMQAVITHPAGVRAGVESPEARQQIDLRGRALEQVVTRSRAQTSEARLAVYSNAYFARLLECLREFFPVLVHALGEELFDQFAIGYLCQHPPRSYTLAQLADRFVPYLEQTQPEPKSETADWPDFVVDLARLEWTIDQVFDGPGTENGRRNGNEKEEEKGKKAAEKKRKGEEQDKRLSIDDLQTIPAADWPAARLVPVPCLRLLAFRFPVNDYYSAVRSGTSPELPAPSPTYLALTRRDFVVQRLDLSLTQFQLLSKLVAGSAVGPAIDQIAAAVDDVEGLATSLENWFRQWSAEGLFQAVTLTTPGTAAQDDEC